MSGLLLIASGCSVSWGFTLGNDARGHLPVEHPLCSIHNRFASNKDVRNLHAKSLQGDRGLASFSSRIPSNPMCAHRVAGWAWKGRLGGSPASRESTRGN